MTGASLFGEINRISHQWVYDKSENLQTPNDFARRFTHLLTAQPDFHNQSFHILQAVYGYRGVRGRKDINLWFCPTLLYHLEPPQLSIGPLEVDFQAKIFVMERKRMKEL